jgi:hypothetical protein
MIAQLVTELGPRFPAAKDLVMLCRSARGTLGWRFSVATLRGLA